MWHDILLKLHYPIHVKEHPNGFYFIAPKGFWYNIVFSGDGVPVVYLSKEVADKAFEEFKAMRKDIKYIEKIYVGL